ncbi:MAG TPA: DUF6263 family protein [Candidatus Kapabacteria bacterium]|nr:DUF6263 family protein [Candidatus Kapabacteria bacterium]
MLRTFLILFSSISLSFTGCAKKGTDAPGGSAVYDTTEKATPVNITDANHFIYFRPKPGETYRYKITLNSTAGAQTEDSLYHQFPPKELATSINTYYLTQTVKQTKPDSSVEFSLAFDSVTMKLDKDTAHIKFSTNDPKTKNDPRFANFTLLTSESFGFSINKYGDVQEIFNTASIINKYMKTFPDSVNTPTNRDKIKQSVEATIAEYLGRTMVRFPEKPLAKDTTISVSREINIPVWQQISLPMHLAATTRMDGFSERGGKVLASFTTRTVVTPTKDGVEDPAAKATLSNMTTNVTESVLVEDATGMLVHREIRDERSWDFMLQAKKKPENFFKTHRSSKDITTVDLLK